MKALPSLVVFVVAALMLLLGCGTAAAQATRTWVSGVGDDANPCSRTAPCKTFAGAISKTAVAGEINCLDPGGFGAVTITKAITISCEAGTAGVLVSGTNGSVVVLTQSTLTGAATAISNTGGSVISYGNNVIRGAGAPTSTDPLQ